MKYLLLLVVLVLIWRHWVKRGNPGRQVSPSASAKPVEKMLTCATCRVHLPESEALMDEGRAFCCEAHRRAARNSPKER